MKPEDQYLKFVRWEEEDQVYIGYCPDLFPWGGVCHAASEEAAYPHFGLWCTRRWRTCSRPGKVCRQ